MVKRASVLGWVIVAAVAGAQGKKPVEIAASGTQSWKPTRMTFATLAQKVSAATAGLKATRADLNVFVRTPEGQGMFFSPSVVLRVKDAMHYRVDYVVVQRIPFSATLVNDGKKRGIRADTKVEWKPASYRLPATKLKGDLLVGLFEIDFARLAFQGLTENQDAWKDIITGWTRGTNGYKAILEERKMRYQGKDILNYRIRAQRTAAAAKKFGASTVEVVFDGRRFLPVTIRVVRTDQAGKSWLAQWQAAYRFNQTIPPSEMQLGTTVAAKAP